MREIVEQNEKILESIIYAPSFKKAWTKFMNCPLSNTPVAFKILEKAFGYKFSDYDGYFIATSHLDAAWLWTAVDSKVRAYKTFHMAIENIKKYPFFSLSMTSPQYYDWIKKYDKDMWEEVKKYVAEGKIDAFGGMWVEPDLNVPCGESLIRQRLYGQLYYLRNFGKISKVESLLDVFGYPNILPQILVKSGAEVFWTTKLTWNDYSLWPFANYLWRGPDGSEIFTHMFKFNIMAFTDLGLYKTTARRPKKKNLVFDSHKLKDCRYITPLNIMGTHIGSFEKSTLSELDKVLSKDYVRTLGLFYGLGDGGKGPLDLEIDIMAKISQFYGYKHTTAHNYFQILVEDIGDNLITWDDEMYLEYHRGTLTTHAKVKRGNRFAENSTINAECLSTGSIISLYSNQFDYPKQLFNDCWQKILFNQFHDILPGSSIPEVYLLTWKEHDYVIEHMNNMMMQVLQKIHGGLEDSDKNILVYNPVSVPNDLYINRGAREIYVGSIGPNEMITFSKDDVKISFDTEETELFSAENEKYIILQNSYLKAVISKIDGNLKLLQLRSEDSESDIGNFLYGERNGFQRKTAPEPHKIDDLDSGILKLKGARVKAYHEVFDDNPYPAWNISANYTQHPLNLRYEYSKINYSEKDRIEICCHYMLDESEIVVRYLLKRESKMLHVNFDIDMKTPEVILKYFVPVNLSSQEVVAEMQFGTVTRTRCPETAMEKGKWEFSLQKWMDISDEDYGLSVLNDSKFAASANKDGFAMTLLRTPIYASTSFYNHEKHFNKGEKPNHTDLMEHHIEMALIPHKKTWKEAKIPQRAIAFNNRPLVVKSSGSSDVVVRTEDFQNLDSSETSLIVDGKLIKFPAFSTDKENVIIAAVKPSEWIAEIVEDKGDPNGRERVHYSSNGYLLPEDPDAWEWDEKSVIIRAYEAHGDSTNSELSLKNIADDLRIDRIEEIDLLEWNVIREIESDKTKQSDGSVAFIDRFGKYEIKTYRITFKK